MFRAFSRQHILWIGLGIIIIPLLLILWLQYRSLIIQERTLPAYRKEMLRGRLNTINQEIELFYRAQAEQALEVPAGSIPSREDGCVIVRNMQQDLPEILQPVADYFSRQQFRGARRYFFGVRVGRPARGAREFWALLMYDPVSRKMKFEGGSQDWTIALAGFATCRLAPVNELGYYSHKYAPEHPVLMKSVINAQGRMIGGAGMMLDENYFANQVVPELVRRALPELPAEEAQHVIVSIEDHNQRARWSNQQPETAGSEVEVRAPFTFAFSAWMLYAGWHPHLERHATRRLLLNLVLPLLLALLIFSGLVLSLHLTAREMKLSQMKSDFVSNVSHELRTPLTSIRTFGEFLRLGRVNDPERIRKYGEYIENESHRLTQLINNILDFSRIESGRKSYRFEKADVTSFVTETLRSFDVRLRQEGFSIRLESASSVLPLVFIDVEALAQAFINLLDNAMKYSGKSREIVVRLEQREQNVLISVIDFGIGISEEDQEKIFEKFYRVSTGAVHNIKGSGLGLTIVRHIVEAHQGRITLASASGSGSTFTMHLPVAERQTIPAELSARLQAGSAWQTAERINTSDLP